MTIKPSGSSLSMNEINTEFSRGTNLNSYRGTQWFTDAGGSGSFSASNIAFSDFYGKRKDQAATLVDVFLEFQSSSIISIPSVVSGFASLMLVGGGGGGGGIIDYKTLEGGGGGGAGGVIFNDGTITLVPNGTLQVSVGGGGTGYTGSTSTGYGINTVVTHYNQAGAVQWILTAYGGGRGATESTSATQGGSGGGGCPYYGAQNWANGISGQGNAGSPGAEDAYGGGGGGAGGPGIGKDGGSGRGIQKYPSRWYTLAGGGAGNSGYSGQKVGVGGSAPNATGGTTKVGGDGGYSGYPTYTFTAGEGVQNTGSGGGGGTANYNSTFRGGNGGSGVVAFWARMGSTNKFSFSITGTNNVNVNLYDLAVSKGWNKSDPLDVTIEPGAIVYGSYPIPSSNSGAALFIGSNCGYLGIKLTNKGTIMGVGGNGAGVTGLNATGTTATPQSAGSGGTALWVGASNVTVINQGYILGGGGGGGMYYRGTNSYTIWGGSGGGGAGGGNGGPSGIWPGGSGGTPGNPGGNPTGCYVLSSVPAGNWNYYFGCGGGGGRVVPGTGGIGGVWRYPGTGIANSGTANGNGGGSGGGGGALVQKFSTALQANDYGYDGGKGGDSNVAGYGNKVTTFGAPADYPTSFTGGGGGGGWGATGGGTDLGLAGTTYNYGGTGGRAIQVSGIGYTLTNNGTIYGGYL